MALPSLQSTMIFALAKHFYFGERSLRSLRWSSLTPQSNADVYPRLAMARTRPDSANFGIINVFQVFAGATNRAGPAFSKSAFRQRRALAASRRQGRPFFGAAMLQRPFIQGFLYDPFVLGNLVPVEQNERSEYRYVMLQGWLKLTPFRIRRIQK